MGTTTKGQYVAVVTMESLAIFCFLNFVAGYLAVRYDGYQTIRIAPYNKDQRIWLHILELLLKDKIDVWQTGYLKDHSMDVMVPPRFQDEFKELLDAKQVPYHVIIEDVQSLADSQILTTESVNASAIFDYTRFHTYEEIQQWMSDFAADYRTIVTHITLTTSYEGRTVGAIKLSGKKQATPKKAVWWQGGIHAREWISPAVMMWIAKSMVDDYGTDPVVTAAMNNFDFYIVPSLNVDGYEYTWTNDRLWRKTRSSHNKTCTGVDPNRNYDYHWGGKDAGTSACSENYRGPFANSEKIVEGSTEFLVNLAAKTDVVCFIDFHAYSQLLLYPWSYTSRAQLPSDTVDHRVGANKFTIALESVYGTDYTIGPSARTLYAASGCSVDWGYGALGAKYSYVCELRDTGNYGFLLPANQIEPSGIETYEAIKALAGHMLKEYFP